MGIDSERGKWLVKHYQSSLVLSELLPTTFSSAFCFKKEKGKEKVIGNYT